MLNIAFDPSAYPEALRNSLAAALRGEGGGRRVPGKFLYHSPAQAHRWLVYHEAWSPSRHDEDLQALYRETFAEALAELGGRGDGLRDGLRYVSLGCGGGDKDARFLLEYRAAVERTGTPPGRGTAHYRPLDASPALVLEAVLHVREQAARGSDRRGAGWLTCDPLVADLEAEPSLAGWLGSGGGPAVVGCFGMLPNMPPGRFPAYLARMLGPADVLLLSANLSPGGLTADRARMLAQYDNPPAREWYAGALAELGVPREAVAWRVEGRPLDQSGEAWRIVVTAEALRDWVLRVDGTEILMRRGEELQVFTSNRYTPRALERLLAGAGLIPGQRRLMESEEEGIWLCRRA